jgi:A/G-specific adenine glycosylase
VLTAWSGLGYYSRARNLQRAAQQIIAGRLPATHDELLALPGIGPYTAAAIGSIALNLPVAALDGNVMRVISRVSNDSSEISSPVTKRAFAERANELLDRKRPGDFNQAMMELGATVCTPRNPVCSECTVNAFCEARAAGTERTLPVKLRKQQARDVALDLALILRDGRILLVQRAASEQRLAGFWELPEKNTLAGFRGKRILEFRHQIVNDRFQIAIWSATTGHVTGSRWFEPSEIEAIPLTTVTKKTLARVKLS